MEVHSSSRMGSIKEILDSLPQKDRDQLMVAFELGVAQTVSLDGDGLLLGVNTQTIDGFKVEQQAGRWAVGRVRTKQT